MNVLKDLVVQGLPLKGELIIDSHCHVSNTPSIYIPFNCIEDIKRDMDRIGISQACICGLNPGNFGDNSRENDIVGSYVRTYPNRFLGYYSVPTNYKNEIVREYDRSYSKGLKLGAKFHVYRQDYNIDDKYLMPLYERINERRGICINHDFRDTDRLKKLLVRFCDISFVTGHFISAYDDSYIALARKHDNFYINTCGAVSYGKHPLSLAELVRKTSSEKILFGSDFVCLDYSWGLGEVLFARIGDDEKRNILGINIQKIIDRSREMGMASRLP